MPDIELDPAEILLHEFEYAQSTAEQAQDDRTTILNLYLLLVGGVGSIIIGLGQSNPSLPHNLYALIFALLGVIGFFILFKIVRLRQAWHDSALAMNRIKDFYLEKFPELDKAFLWRTASIPPSGKLWTITFGLSLLVMLIDSAAAASAVYFFGVRLVDNEYIASILAAVIFFAWQMWFYFFQLRDN